ncbi:MAG: ostA-like family protein [Alphaproteobacteria bacterium]|nr:ostA-like family protein [Alphaproteobacteria bacterium]
MHKLLITVFLILIPILSQAAPAKTSEPLEITAQESLEWKREEKLFRATGQARAQQGDATISAQSLTARYQNTDEKSFDIQMLEADGQVTITSRDNTITGDHGTYDIASGLAVITGKDLRLTAPDQTVTAQERFEYNTRAGRFDAYGDATIIRAEDTLKADKITAVLKTDAQGKRVLDTMTATGNVSITTPTETVRGATGTYNARQNTAELKGGVTITRGPNQLQGEWAEVDLNTNTSRLFAGPASQGRVRGIFYPGAQNSGPP